MDMPRYRLTTYITIALGILMFDSTVVGAVSLEVKDSLPYNESVEDVRSNGQLSRSVDMDRAAANELTAEMSRRMYWEHQLLLALMSVVVTVVLVVILKRYLKNKRKTSVQDQRKRGVHKKTEKPKE